MRYIEKEVLIDPQDSEKGKRVVGYKDGPKKGQPILEHRPAIYFHDMRRSVYRNLIRLGALEKVAQHRPWVGTIRIPLGVTTSLRKRIWMYCANDTMRPKRTVLLEPETEPVCGKNGQKACKLLRPRSSGG